MLPFLFVFHETFLILTVIIRVFVSGPTRMCYASATSIDS